MEARHGIEMYRRVFAVGSTPFERLSTLYLGALRICAQGKKAAAAGDAVLAEQKADKVAAVVRRLDACLDFSIDPDLCANLARLYAHILERLSDPKTPYEAQAFDEVNSILQTLWEGFQEANAKANR